MASGNEFENNKITNIKYTLIGIDIDTTGRRLVNEMVHLAAYTPEKQFSQYIMPYMNMNAAARKRHQITVVTIDFYRVLKNMKTHKVVQSKSEISTINEFLDWIELIKTNDPDSNGIILLYHENRKFIPCMILKAMKKYDLLERFDKTVKYFVNGFDLIKNKFSNKFKSYSLRHLSKIMIENNNSDEDKKQFQGNASVRAKMAYEIVKHLSIIDNNDDNNKIDDFELMLNILIDNANSLSKELNELDIQSKNMDCQNSFRPIFLHYFKSTITSRVKAVKYRIKLADNGYNYDSIKSIWNTKQKEGLSEIIQRIKKLKLKEKNELIEILDCHFDPNKKPYQPPLIKSNEKDDEKNENSDGLIDTKLKPIEENEDILTTLDSN